MANNTQSVNAAVDAAVVPLNEVLVADLAAGAAGFDAWLREYTGGYVTLERVKEMSAALPVLGNVMAAVDVCGDIVTLVERRDVQRPEIDRMLDWASLAINLIGVMPIPPGTAAARMSLRPALGIVRQTVKAGGADLGKTIVAVIAGHITATLMGELQPFVEKAQAQLQTLLTDCGDMAAAFLNTLADALDALARGHLTDPNANLKAASEQLAQVSASSLVHSPLKSIDNLFGAVWEVSKAGAKTEINAVAGGLASLAPGRTHQLASTLRGFIPEVKSGLASLSGSEAGTILYMLNILAQALRVYQEKKHRLQATVKRNAANQAKKKHAGDEVEVRSDEAMARKPGAERCKACQMGQPATATAHSISFALGDEQLDHSDFVLPGVMPVEWVRTYRSNFGAHDIHGPLGARWTTPFHASMEVRGDTVVYHDPSGRSLEYPLRAIGKPHYDAIGQRTLTRVSDTQLRLAHGSQIVELFERHDTVGGTRFLLTSIADRSGNTLVLTYSDGRLATLANRAGEVAGFTHDDMGRITRIALIDGAGKPLRALAGYRYDEAGDLVEAFDEDGAARQYAYSHHLVTRYTDRTGRGMNLQWDGTHLDAKAIHEWADDGTFSTRLEWHDRLRLSAVTDALGGVTHQYYDIDGYPYRVVHPDGTEEWFFRDDAKNVTRRVHRDGAEEHFTWDARSNLTSHTARDGRTAYFVYDQQDNLTGLQDPEGYRWERNYDGRGNVTEAVDPLGRVTKYKYDRAGLPVEIIDSKGGTKAIAWREDGQIASFTDCSGKTSTWKYDGRGRLVQTRNAAGETTRYEYEAGQLAAVIHPDQTREVFARDAEGRLLTHTDALNRQTQYHYTRAGLLSARVNARGDELSYIWNPLGQITGLRNENGREYRFGYDEGGRLVSETGFDGRTTRYFREAGSGVLTNRLDGDVMQSFAYHGMERPLQPIAIHTRLSSTQTYTKRR